MSFGVVVGKKRDYCNRKVQGYCAPSKCKYSLPAAGWVTVGVSSGTAVDKFQRWNELLTSEPFGL